MIILSKLDARLGDYIEVERRSRVAVAAVRQDADPDVTTEVMALDLLASAQANLGKHQEAARSATEALELARRHPHERGGQILVRALVEAALHHLSSGGYALAEELGREAMTRARELPGPDDVELYMTLDGLEALYGTMGSSTVALIREKADLSRAAGDLRRLLTDLVRLSDACTTTGHHAEAATHLEEASGLMDRLGSQPESLRELAGGYAYAGDHAKAEPLLRQALEGTSDRRVEAQIAAQLARSYVQRGAVELAEPLLERVLRIRRETKATRSELADALVSSAALYRQQVRHRTAELYAREAVALWQRPGEEPGPDSRNALHELAKVCATTGRTEEALALVRTVAVVDERLASQVFTIGSDAQRLDFVRLMRVTTALMLSIALLEPRAVPEALTLVLRRKALAAEAVASRRDALLAGRYPELADQVEEHRALRLRLATQSVSDFWKQAPASSVALQHQVEELERELARAIPEIDVVSRLRDVDADAVAAELPADSALVEFVRFGRVSFPGPGGQPVRTYAAFVLHSCEPRTVTLVELGAAADIEVMVGGYRRALSETVRSGSVIVARAPGAPRRVEAQLRETLFDPLLPALGGVRRIFLAPAAELSRLPFQTLPVGNGRRLVDDYSISYLSVGRDLLRFSASARGWPAAPVILADPAFDLTQAEEPPPWSPGTGSRSRELPRGLRPFSRLPGARREGDTVAGLLGTQALVGDHALKARVESVRSPVVLHFATHGFSLPGRPPAGDVDSGAPATVRAGAPPGEAALENPLLRCGLALAGANTWLRTGSVHADAGDGILSGEDAAALDLGDTELVVLSACDTGLGDVHVDEGVLGLPRAFLLAGAKTVVMSLWTVPDDQTYLLMTKMYARLLAGVPRAQALREAQLAVKARFPDPAYWGGFVCVGAPGPLPADVRLRQDEPHSAD